ncbi:MAG: hypothetical protein J6N95_03890 [Bacilli bacterium]|nr:hypothetical protein [Bacilli bacterium]
MKKINAYAEKTLPSDTTVLINDYPNQDNEPELAINTCLGDEVINLYRTSKEDGSVEFIVITLDKETKKLVRYKVKETGKTIAKDGVVDIVFGMFESTVKQYEKTSL